MPLQLISLFYFIFLLRPAFSAGIVAKHGCLDRCGNLSIPYPFGIGSKCFLEASFEITCHTSNNPPKPYLSIINKEIIEINQSYVRVKYPPLISVCYDSPDYKHGNMSLNLSGTPYTLSSSNILTVIGCDDAVLQYSDMKSSGCSAFCSQKNDSGGMGYCPINGKSIGIGCCETIIIQDFLGAWLIDTSQKLLRKRLFPCSHVIIRERNYDNETVFSYPLHYLDNSKVLVNDNWASATSSPVVRLEWNIKGAENCSEAKRNNNTYACLDKKSVCLDDSQVPSFSYPVRGYSCSCVAGYEGNPYVAGGCRAISFSSSIAKNGCQDQCGKLSIPYPFGIGPNCYLAPSFDIECNTSTNPPKARLSILHKEIIDLTSSHVLVNYPNLGFSCYSMSDIRHKITNIEVRTLIIDLSGTQYTLSDQNWITTIGCDDMVVGLIRQANRSFIGSSCATVCEDRQLFSSYGHCPRGDCAYQPGNGCCKASIPRGTTYLEANLSDLSGRWPRTNFSCSYAFVSYVDTISSSFPFAMFNNSTGTTPDYLYQIIDGHRAILTLDWRIGAMNCSEAKSNPSTFACQANTDCIDFDSTVGGYLCNCSKGYQGNPYLAHGCKDIDECADSSTNTCVSNSNCSNTEGSFHCTCPEGYFGDGKKDGSGCFKLPKSKSKMIILTGMSSGLGFLLLVLICLWMYKMVEMRKKKMLKEKYFKRNGGLLLRQQTNEGPIGKTNVYSANELEVATDQFNESRILGHGGQGTVYKGMLSNGKIVAIKKSKLVQTHQLLQFINEVVILSQINHRNVVRLLGCCLETEVPLLVYEFMPNGTLYDLIHDPHNEFPFLWSMRMKMAADIAGALAYLHSASSTPIYHRDIKSSNILLDEKYVVKVSDFGTSKSVDADQTHLTTKVRGTFGYLDPEYFQSSQLTEKSDVYSFGVVLVEFLTGQRPISLNETDEDRGLAARFLTSMEENYLDMILDPQVSEQGKKKEDVIQVARLAQRCLNLKGKMRPTMKEVATELESLQISQMPIGAKDEYEQVRDFEDMSTLTTDSEYTRTASYKSETALPSDTNPLMFTTDVATSFTNTI